MALKAKKRFRACIDYLPDAKGKTYEMQFMNLTIRAPNAKKAKELAIAKIIWPHYNLSIREIT
jgi:hypothetical protein